MCIVESSSTCSGILSPPFRLYTHVFADTRDDDLTRFESDSSAWRHTIISSLADPSLISSADVKIIVPDVHPFSNVRALLDGTDEWTVHHHGTPWLCFCSLFTLAHGDALHCMDQSLSPLATWKVKAFVAVHAVLAFLRDPSRVIHGLVFLVPSAPRGVGARCTKFPISVSSGQFADLPRFDHASPLWVLAVICAITDSATL